MIERRLIGGQKELTINDTKVYFPYEPYKVQVEYMQNVMDALKLSGNAVLESPTGTGKTLCLLASVLSFVEKQFRN
jgi:regulator of telomere elongation helicase 1